MYEGEFDLDLIKGRLRSARELWNINIDEDINLITVEPTQKLIDRIKTRPCRKLCVSGETKDIQCLFSIMIGYQLTEYYRGEPVTTVESGIYWTFEMDGDNPGRTTFFVREDDSGNLIINCCCKPSDFQWITGKS